MSNFEVKIQKIFVKSHPNADKLEIGNIGSPDGWQVVIGKGLYQTGDLVAYIGENAVVPEWVLKKYGYWNEEKGKGMLAGSKGTRVKAVRLRDEFSLGIVIPLSTNQELSNLVNTTEEQL
jgi:RNA ligase (TIGR02306 family)